MRTGQTSRPYGRNYGNNANRNRQQMPPRGQNLDSNGPNVKIRGTPHQIFERHVALAREASTSGDRVAAENFCQTLRERRLPRNMYDREAMLASLDRLEGLERSGARIFFGHDPEFWQTVPQAPVPIT